MNNASVQLLLVGVVLVGLWVTFIYLTGQVAADRGHDPGVWYFAAIVLGPIALVAALAAPYTPERNATAVARSLSGYLQQGSPPAPTVASTVPAMGSAGRSATTAPGNWIGLRRWRVVASSVTNLQPSSEVEVRVQGGRVVLVSSTFSHRTRQGEWRATVKDDGTLVFMEGPVEMARLAPVDGQDANEAVGLVNGDA